ncbi:hypothetical protein [Sulfobacillus harzensis]|uniref:Uncharacterized protein n=1 Tax=Sulfobacillus harzensis TaxID=2729629 RepID=A0A7Y0Q3J8_9FIRM|nr:hypothetical protein [Sulfobacillus harzensis]NMP23465.1 hypothetical protein [Sulfobacillus harzensis]
MSEGGLDPQVFRQRLVALAVSGDVLGWWDWIQCWRRQEHQRQRTMKTDWMDDADDRRP